jgi:prepilin-type N-terminal cleavage/methylation domain-containing protein
MLNVELSKCGFRNADLGMKTPNSQLRTPDSPSPSPLPRGERVWVRGMTLIEVIMVMTIIGILAATLTPKFDFATSSRASVDGAAYMMSSDIRYAQEFAMANRVSKSVIFTSGSSVYAFNPTNNLDPSGRLPSGVTISNNLAITFNSLGEPISGGGSSVTVSGGGLTRTITVVNYTGKVNVS